MMKRFTIILFTLASVIAFTSCGSAQSTINDLQSLNYELQNNSDRFTAEDWHDAKNKLDKIQKKVKKYDFTDEQLKEIGALTASCYVHMGKNKVKTSLKDVNSIIRQAQGAAEEIKSIIEELKQNYRDNR